MALPNRLIVGKLVAGVPPRHTPRTSLPVRARDPLRDLPYNAGYEPCGDPASGSSTLWNSSTDKHRHVVGDRDFGGDEPWVRELVEWTTIEQLPRVSVDDFTFGRSAKTRRAAATRAPSFSTLTKRATGLALTIHASPAPVPVPVSPINPPAGTPPANTDSNRPVAG